MHLEALAQRDHREVVAEPRRVHGEDLLIGLVDVRRERAAPRLHHQLGRDEVRIAGAREHAFDAHPHEVRILAVVLDPLGDLRLVREAHVARVDAVVGVALGLRARLEELAGGPGRVAEAAPDDLGAGIGQRATRHLIDQVVNRRRLVEQAQDALALVVHAGEGFGVVRRPGHRVDPPTLLAHGVVGDVDRRRRELEEALGDEKLVPLGQLGPGLRAELRVGVRRDDAARVGMRGHRPQDQPRHLGALADAVTRGDVLLDHAAVLAAGADAIADATELLFLPLLRAFFVFQLGARLPPRERPHHEAVRVIRVGGQIVEQLIERRALDRRVADVRGPHDHLRRLRDAEWPVRDWRGERHVLKITDSEISFFKISKKNLSSGRGMSRGVAPSTKRRWPVSLEQTSTEASSARAPSRSPWRSPSGRQPQAQGTSGPCSHASSKAQHRRRTASGARPSAHSRAASGRSLSPGCGTAWPSGRSPACPG